MNPLGLPREEDVTEINMGSHRVSVIRLTNENSKEMLEVALSMYFGEQRKYCGRIYETTEDLKDTVYAGHHEYGRLACKSCWQENNPNPSLAE